VLKQIAEGRSLVSGHNGGRAAAAALIAKGEACAEALYLPLNMEISSNSSF
jgi:hypothetical protein